MGTMEEKNIKLERFFVYNYEIEVKGEQLIEALKKLPERKRNVVLLAFFIGMKDTEISQVTGLARSTVHHHRVTSLRILKDMIDRNG